MIYPKDRVHVITDKRKLEYHVVEVVKKKHITICHCRRDGREYTFNEENLRKVGQ